MESEAYIMTVQVLLTDRKEFVSINGFNSDLMPVDCGVPQSSALQPLLFLIRINDLHKTI